MQGFERKFWLWLSLEINIFSTNQSDSPSYHLLRSGEQEPLFGRISSINCWATVVLMTVQLISCFCIHFLTFDDITFKSHFYTNSENEIYKFDFQSLVSISCFKWTYNDRQMPYGKIPDWQLVVFDGRMFKE